MLRASNCRNLELSPLCFALRAFTHHLVCCFRLTTRMLAASTPHGQVVVPWPFGCQVVRTASCCRHAFDVTFFKGVSVGVLLDCCLQSSCCLLQLRKPLLAGRISLLCSMRGGVSGMGERESGQGPVRANRGDLFSANVCALCEPVKLSHLSLCHF